MPIATVSVHCMFILGSTVPYYTIDYMKPPQWTVYVAQSDLSQKMKQWWKEKCDGWSYGEALNCWTDNQNVTEILKIATNLATHPCISTLLCIFVTLPNTTATTDRSFSALMQHHELSSFTMNDKRLNGLMHLNINRLWTLLLPCYQRVLRKKNQSFT